MKITLILSVAFLFAFSAHIQGFPKLTASNVNATRNTAGFISSGKANRSACRVVYYSGTVKSLSSKDGQPVAVILEASSKKKLQVAFDDDSFDYFSGADREKFVAQMTKGAKVSIGAFVCGSGSKAHKQIFSVDFI